ncbi:V-type proton ATPase subunit G 3-like [Erpetoichthys calabaricus]|uniref:V-type proton ATPase subunit G n=1 Tax=Erpetoichthys calabaricus TaxID=27687 RepID=A0A8C4XBA4_ERPCA|nr:V-type proton ATPase subunit G 3-like [Erpetoichthys calabaricus]
MASKSHGIQHLLQAEKKAKEKLDEAKKRKVKRLKQAKDEAFVEIENYRQMRENNFKQKQSTIMGSHGNLSVKVDEQTKTKIQSLNSNYSQYKEALVQHIIDMSRNLKTELHKNYRG